MRPLVLLLILVLIAAGVYFAFKFEGSGVQAYEFNGQVQKVDGSTIYLYGTYNSAANPELRGADQAREVKIKTNPQTKFVKTVLYRPANFVKLVQSGKTLDPNTFRREVKVGALADFKDGGVREATALSESNIYNKSSFTADSVTYYQVADEK